LNIQSQNNRGKRIFLFPLFFFILCVSLQAQWQAFFFGLANLHNTTVINLDALKTAQKKLTVDYHYEDIYRKFLIDDPAISIRQNRCKVQISLPFHKIKYIHLFQTSTGFSKISADNQPDLTSVNGSFAGSGFDQSAIWTTSNGKYLMGLQGRFSKSSGLTDLNIDTYPKSDDSKLNKYFLNWLPLTFGSPISTDISTRLTKIGGWYSLPITGNARLHLQLSRTISTDLLKFNYLNTTNKDTLNGIRQLDIPLDLNQNQVAVSWIRPGKNLSSVTLKYMGAQFTYHSDNHPPPGADYSSLGDGSLEFHSLAFSTNYTVRQHRFETGVSGASFHGDFEIQTPVLGYTTLLFIPVPIAHKACGKIRNGRALSQNLRYLTNFRFGQIEAQFSINYLHSRYKLRIDGEAQLELGLLSTSIDYPIKIDANIFDTKLLIRKRFNQLHVIYSIQQLLPIINRLDDSPIKFTKKVPGKEIRERGGQIHQLGIEYYF